MLPSTSARITRGLRVSIDSIIIIITYVVIFFQNPFICHHLIVQKETIIPHKHTNRRQTGQNEDNCMFLNKYGRNARTSDCGVAQEHRGVTSVGEQTN